MMKKNGANGSPIFLLFVVWYTQTHKRKSKKKKRKKRKGKMWWTKWWKMGVFFLLVFEWKVCGFMFYNISPWLLWIRKRKRGKKRVLGVLMKNSLYNSKFSSIIFFIHPFPLSSLTLFTSPTIPTCRFQTSMFRSS